jgi:hypothetical protein
VIAMAVSSASTRSPLAKIPSRKIERGRGTDIIKRE